MAITISEIAKLAGVSRTTVSYVLNGKGNIPDSTRERVLKIMQEHDKNYMAIRQADGIRKAKEDGKYTGRKKQPVDPILLAQVTRQFRSGVISEAEAMQRLNIHSRSTLYRRMREISI